MRSKRFLIAVLVLSCAAIALPLSVTAEAPVLWHNGEYGYYGLTSEENSYISISSRTADDFELPPGCLWYTIELIRGEMLMTQGNAPDAYVEIYADSGAGGPAETSIYTVPMSSGEYLGPARISPFPESDWERYAFTFETSALTLPPGHHWLSIYNVDGPGTSQEPYLHSYFATTAPWSTYLLQKPYWKGDYWGMPDWTLFWGELNAIFEIEGFCAYPFTGFFSPVDNAPTVNVVKAGSAVPVKFSLGGDAGLDIFAAGYPLSWQVPCPDGALDSVEETVTAGGSSLQYDPVTQQYTYVWKTGKGWAGTCREFVLGVKDGANQTALFSFK